MYDDTTFYDFAMVMDILPPHNERRWEQQWRSGYQTQQQEQSIRFLPLCDVVDERYTLYFPVQERA